MTTRAETGAATRGGSVTLQLAHSYTETQPQHRCGAQVIADEVENADVGVTVEIFPASALGGDADRIASVVSGDIDMDIQGASALGAVYEPVSVLDAAYAFDDSDHLARFFDSDASDDLLQGFEDETGVHTLGAWSAGMRQFTANEPIRSPDDLDGLRMRFPASPQFLMNAEALGAEATEVAYEELFLALQQGTVDGQENPITNIAASSLQDVQDYISMSNHQANSNLVIIGAEPWGELSSEQQEALTEPPSTRPRSRCPGASRRTRRRPSPSGRRAAPSRSSTTSTWRPSAPRSTPTSATTSTRTSSPSTRPCAARRSDLGGGGADLPRPGRRR